VKLPTSHYKLKKILKKERWKHQRQVNSILEIFNFQYIRWVPKM